MDRFGLNNKFNRKLFKTNLNVFCVVFAANFLQIACKDVKLILKHHNFFLKKMSLTFLVDNKAHNWNTLNFSLKNRFFLFKFKTYNFND